MRGVYYTDEWSAHCIFGGTLRRLLSQNAQKYLLVGLAFVVATVAGIQLITCQIESVSPNGPLPPVRISMTLLFLFLGVMPAWCTALLCFARASYWFHLAFYLWLLVLLAFFGGRAGGIDLSLGLLIIPGLPIAQTLTIVVFKPKKAMRLPAIYSVIYSLYLMLSFFLMFFCFQVPYLQNFDDSLYSQVVFFIYCSFLSLSSVLVLLIRAKSLAKYFLILLLSMGLILLTWFLWTGRQYSVLLSLLHVGSLLLFIYPLALSIFVVEYGPVLYRKLRTISGSEQ